MDVFNVVRQIRMNRPEFLVDEVITAVSMSCFSMLPLWRSYCRAIARCLAPLYRSLQVEGRCRSGAPALLFGSFTYTHHNFHHWLPASICPFLRLTRIPHLNSSLPLSRSLRVPLSIISSVVCTHLFIASYLPTSSGVWQLLVWLHRKQISSIAISLSCCIQYDFNNIGNI